MPVGYFTISEQGLILEANLTGVGLLGVGRSDVVRQPITHFILSEDQDILLSASQTTFPTGRPHRRAICNAMTRDADPFWVQLEATVVRGGQSDEPVHRVVLSDITDEKRAEEKLAELDRRKDQFLAVLSHELRNPLAPILNAVQLLQLQKGQNSVQHRVLAIIERQVGQLAHLVSDLLEVSRAITGRIQLCQERGRREHVVEHAVETARPLIDQRRHELTLSLPPDPIWLYADASRRTSRNEPPHQRRQVHERRWSHLALCPAGGQ